MRRARLISHYLWYLPNGGTLADDQLDRSQIGRLQSEGTSAAWNRNQTVAPSTGQCLKDRVAEHICVVSVTAEVGAVFPQRLVKHQTGEFIERLRAQILVVGGREGRGGIAQLGKRRQQGRRLAPLAAGQVNPRNAPGRMPARSPARRRSESMKIICQEFPVRLTSH